MADLATLQSWLTEAEAARHALSTGQRIKEVWRDGRRVIFEGMSAGTLGSYIDGLNAAIAALNADTSGALPRRRFIGTCFG